jgi:copper(I)-binding protein
VNLRQRRRPHPPRRAVALALGLPLLLAGCGAGFEAQTYQERTAFNGTNTATGAIALRNVTVLPPPDDRTLEAGSDAEVMLTLTNDGPEQDELLEVTSPAAESVELLVDGEPTSSVELPRLSSTGGSLGLRLIGLSQELSSGEYLELTFRFERNGTATFDAAVATTGEYDDDRERSENFHQIGEHEGE